MPIRRSFILVILGVLAIAGELFVSDRRTALDTGSALHPIQAGDSLRLGLMWADLPATQPRNHAITHALFHLRDHVNQCGGVNQSPLFLVPTTPAVDTVTEATLLEPLAMKTLLWRKRVHGVLAIVTPSSMGYDLYSEALNVAMDGNLPTISPVNTQALLLEPPIRRFQRDRPPQDIVNPHWIQAVPSDRRYVDVLAQWLMQQSWTRIAVVTPDSDWGQYQEQVIDDAIALMDHSPLSLEPLFRYSVPAVTDTGAEPDLPVSEVGAEAPAEPGEVGVDPTELESGLADNPDAVLLLLEPGMTPASMGQMMTQLLPPLHAAEIPLILGHRVEGDRLDSLAQSVVAAQPIEVDANSAPDNTAPDNTAPDAEETTAPAPLSAMAGLHGITLATPELSPSSSRLFSSILDTTPHADDPAIATAVGRAWDSVSLMILAAAAAGHNTRSGIVSELPDVATAPGIKIMDVCEGLAQVRNGSPINYQGVSGPMDLDHRGQVTLDAGYEVWRINGLGDRETLEPVGEVSPHEE